MGRLRGLLRRRTLVVLGLMLTVITATAVVLSRTGESPAVGVSAPRPSGTGIAVPDTGGGPRLP